MKDWNMVNMSEVQNQKISNVKEILITNISLSSN